jgi:hypothetical protein
MDDDEAEDSLPPGPAAHSGIPRRMYDVTRGWDMAVVNKNK